MEYSSKRIANTLSKNTFPSFPTESPRIYWEHLSKYVFFLSQIMATWILFALFTLVSCQLDLPPLREDPREDFGRRLPPNESQLQDILARVDFLGTERCSANVVAQWSYETDVNEYTQLQAASTNTITTLPNTISVSVNVECNVITGSMDFVTETPALVPPQDDTNFRLLGESRKSGPTDPLSVFVL